MTGQWDFKGLDNISAKTHTVGGGKSALNFNLNKTVALSILAYMQNPVKNNQLVRFKKKDIYEYLIPKVLNHPIPYNKSMFQGKGGLQTQLSLFVHKKTNGRVDIVQMRLNPFAPVSLFVRRENGQFKQADVLECYRDNAKSSKSWKFDLVTKATVDGMEINMSNGLKLPTNARGWTPNRRN